MRIFKHILVTLLAIFTLISIAGMFLPSKWQVQRSIVIHAPAASIYPWIANFKTGWPKWSKFDLEDPGVSYSYSGPDEGVGATRNWISKEMGNGFQKITQADSASGIEFELGTELNRMRLIGKIMFKSQGSDTEVTWTDSGEVGMNPYHRIMAALMDKIMGNTFEESLKGLKVLAETPRSSR